MPANMPDLYGYLLFSVICSAVLYVAVRIYTRNNSDR